MMHTASTALPVVRQHRAAALLRMVAIGLTAFLTLVDLFATQAILPSLARAYGVSPAAMGIAVNASTFGMAIAALVVAHLGRRIDRRRGILISLGALAIPTALLAIAPDLTVFTSLRIIQGLFMAAAFTLTLAYLAEHCSARSTASAFAAYVTGNVASNLFGRLLSAALADHLGLAGNFVGFAALNLLGAALVWFTLARTPLMEADALRSRSPRSIWVEHLRNPALAASFGIGFCILFAFIGTFTYVNFVLVRAPFTLGMMQLGLVYLVFVPSIATTPVAGRIVLLFGTRPALWASLGLAVIGLPLLLASDLAAVLIGLALVGVGTFFAQATVTGFVGRTATGERASASGFYLASYFMGGLAGSAALGMVYDRSGWTACVVGIGVALLIAALLGRRLTTGPVVPSAAERIKWSGPSRAARSRTDQAPP